MIPGYTHAMDPDPPTPARSAWAIPLGLTALAAALRFVGLDLSSLWLDEAYEVAAAAAPLGEAAVFETNQPPLHRVLLGLWMGVGGTSESAVRAPAALFGTLAVPAIWVLARRAFGPRAALLAGLLAAVSPYLVYFSKEARGYSLLILLTVLALGLGREAVRQGRTGARIGWAIVAVLGLHTHYFFAFVPLAQAAALPLGPEAGRRLRRMLVPAFAVAVACVPWAAYAAANLLEQDRSYVGSPFGNIATTLLRFATGYSLSVLDSRSMTAPLADRIRETLPAALATLLVFAPLLVLGVRRAWRSPEDGRPLVALLALPPAILVALAPVIPLLHDRYLAFAAPAFVILVALGAASLRPGLGTIAMILVVAVSLAGNARELLGDRCRKEDWRAAARLVEERERPGDELVVHLDHMHWAFRHYYRGASRLVAEEEREPGRSVWLVESHAWGRPHPVLLDRLLEPREEWVFPQQWGIRVVLLEPRASPESPEDRR
jgi:mannosyltransferase